MRPALVAVLLLAAPAAAQLSFEPDLGKLRPAGRRPTSFAEVGTVTARFEPARAKRGEVVQLKVTVSPKPGGWTYPTAPKQKQAGSNAIRVPPPGDLVFVGGVADPPGVKTEVHEGEPQECYPTPATWTLTAVVSPTAAPGPRTVALDKRSRFQVCVPGNCLYADAPPSAPLEILDGPPEPVPPQFAAAFATTANPSVAPPQPKTEDVPAGLVTKDPVPPDRHAAALEQLRGRLAKDTDKLPANGLWAFLLTAVAWGYVSLATPCVFPMIPITVSLFLKQGDRSPRQVLRLAVVYSLTIVAVLGLAAIFLLSAFQALSVSPWTNLFLGGLFVVFALSLFGMYDITLPGFLLRGAERRRASGGLAGIVFGALAFSIVSFTCVAPFLGGFAGMAASGQFGQAELVAGGLAFAAAFASPFLVLALFPSLLKKLPRSGGWLDTVKAVMGFLELAAAVKFFRTAELRLLARPEYLTYDLGLAAMIVIGGACGLYLLGLFRLPHDEERGTIGVPRLMFALAFLGLAAYLVPALFKTPDGQNARPGGKVYAWVDAFLLPEPTAGGAGELPWASDLPAAVERAARQPAGTDGRLVLVDFTGVTCSNCKLNERDVFPRSEVNALLRRYTLAAMYTDEVPAAFYRRPPSDADRDAEAKANRAFQKAAFGTVQLPLYVILRPQADGTVRVVDVYDEGKINDVPRFAEFLRKPLDGKKE
jgi:thiol:disulfide interchange protein DsbD